MSFSASKTDSESKFKTLSEIEILQAISEYAPILKDEKSKKKFALAIIGSFLSTQEVSSVEALLEDHGKEILDSLKTNLHITSENISNWTSNRTSEDTFFSRESFFKFVETFLENNKDNTQDYEKTILYTKILHRALLFENYFGRKSGKDGDGVKLVLLIKKYNKTVALEYIEYKSWYGAKSSVKSKFKSDSDSDNYDY